MAADRSSRGSTLTTATRSLPARPAKASGRRSPSRAVAESDPPGDDQAGEGAGGRWVECREVVDDDAPAGSPSVVRSASARAAPTASGSEVSVADGRRWATAPNEPLAGRGEDPVHGDARAGQARGDLGRQPGLADAHGTAEHHAVDPPGGQGGQDPVGEVGPSDEGPLAQPVRRRLRSGAVHPVESSEPRRAGL